MFIRIRITRSYSGNCYLELNQFDVSWIGIVFSGKFLLQTNCLYLNSCHSHILWSLFLLNFGRLTHLTEGVQPSKMQNELYKRPKTFILSGLYSGFKEPEGTRCGSAWGDKRSGKEANYSFKNKIHDDSKSDFWPFRSLPFVHISLLGTQKSTSCKCSPEI